MYQISMENRRKGMPFYSFAEGYRFLRQSKKHFRLLKKIDRKLSV
jgi:hypothetical protein